jgi:hypothetical protein
MLGLAGFKKILKEKNSSSDHIKTAQSSYLCLLFQILIVGSLQGISMDSHQEYGSEKDFVIRKN